MPIYKVHDRNMKGNKNFPKERSHSKEHKKSV